ncbi:hypothetical protein [Nostoc sp.]
MELRQKPFTNLLPLRRQSLQRGATAVDGNACIKEPARWAALPTCSDWRQVVWEPPQRTASSLRPLRFVYSFYYFYLQTGYY